MHLNHLFYNHYNSLFKKINLFLKTIDFLKQLCYNTITDSFIKHIGIFIISF